MNILFVCSGNISRSFLAEMLLRHEISRKRLKGISVASAGIYAAPGSPPDPRMVSYLIKEGIPVKVREAKQIGTEDIAWADWIFVMEHRHGERLKEMWPEAEDKVKHLGIYLSGAQQVDDIVDPFGRNSYYYRLAQSQITMAVKGLVDRFLKEKTQAGVSAVWPRSES